MVEPIARQQVFRLTEGEKQQVESHMRNLNCQIEAESKSAQLRASTCLLAVGQVSDFILNEIASRFRLAGYLVEAIPATRGGPAMLRLK